MNALPLQRGPALGPASPAAPSGVFSRLPRPLRSELANGSASRLTAPAAPLAPSPTAVRVQSAGLVLLLSPSATPLPLPRFKHLGFSSLLLSVRSPHGARAIFTKLDSDAKATSGAPGVPSCAAQPQLHGGASRDLDGTASGPAGGRGTMGISKPSRGFSSAGPDHRLSDEPGSLVWCTDGHPRLARPGLGLTPLLALPQKTPCPGVPKCATCSQPSGLCAAVPRPETPSAYSPNSSTRCAGSFRGQRLVGTTGGTTPCRTSCGLSRSSAEGARTRPCAPRAASHRWRARDAGGRAAQGPPRRCPLLSLHSPAPSSFGPPSANSVLDKTIIQATIICGWLVGAGRPGR